MPLPRPNQPFVELQRLQNNKQFRPKPAERLSADLVSFFKQVVEKRQGKLGKIAEAWQSMIEEGLCDHCALESLHRGTLTVIVDSSAHLYELKQLLLAGLQQQLLLACKTAGLRKITLKAGRWYTPDEQEKRAKFD